MDGDLTQRLAVRGTDEISLLNKFYNHSIENIQCSSFPEAISELTWRTTAALFLISSTIDWIFSIE
jgi:methyl-accepting chemotaxis protein